MHAAAFHVLRTAQRPILRRVCSTVAGARYPLPRRNFHRSAIAYRVPEEPPDAEPDKPKERTENPDDVLSGKDGENVANDSPVEADRRNSAPSEEVVDQYDANAAIEEQSQPADVESSTAPQRRQARRSGSRPNRSRTPEGLPPVVIPEWFFKENVICAGDNVSEGTLATYSWDTPPGGKAENSNIIEGTADWELPSTQNTKYKVNISIYQEIVLAIRLGLSLRPPKNIPLATIPRPVLHLQCPTEDGTSYLDSIVEATARKLNADIVRLDADDLAQIVGAYIDENLAWTWSRIALLGFETQKVAGKMEDYEKDLRVAEETADIEAEDDKQNLPRYFYSSRISGSRKSSASVTAYTIPLQSFLAGAAAQPRSKSLSSPDVPPKFELYDPNSQQSLKPASEQWLDLKLSAALDALIDAADRKRAISATRGGEGAIPDTPSSRGVIIQVKDFKFLNVLPDGRAVLKKLHDAINKRWGDNQSMMMLGTTSTDEIDAALSKPEIQMLQSDLVDGETRTIFVPPDRKPEQDAICMSDEKVRIRRINIRHVEDMILKLGGGNLEQAITIDIEPGIDSATAFSSEVENQVWSYPRVHRLATTMIGLNTSVSNIDGATFTRACSLLEASDEAKFAWGITELKDEDEAEAVLQSSKNPAKTFKDKIKRIRREATAHEKKLLGGIISPFDISTTFSAVHAPKVTVEALRTMTSLSLIRPEAFSYGVLATDKIPGLLLYGPPGTGKTLLAKAVAKESGATVLEVSGAEVTDMYVGEGEKNVKAIFSLAKKLSPCIVFIDEADSLLGSRSGESSKRTTHRETINQFLREWDGLSDLSAFIMVATNRPFDLDEAVLRRLPRRLLVDLPLEQDREAILKIHLKDEVLDDSVSLANLAKETPFYSGSDLKNVAVSAAMACIREENEVALKYDGEEPYVYPPKRLLMKHHFTKALDEISASISEDMGTLGAIRKFDQKYGDRRGRRKKPSSLGFGGTSTQEKDSEAARVRKMEA